MIAKIIINAEITKKNSNISINSSIIHIIRNMFFSQIIIMNNIINIETQMVLIKKCMVNIHGNTKTI